ncbi:MAG: MmgE/PrpD family protein [Eggerthellaceae bacterium]|nr:MmgE/PrpD family protein [Eggerthellaceae bacterium]
MDLATRIAQTVVGTTYDDLSAEDVLAAKMAVLDTLGCMLAGTGAGEGVGEVMGLVSRLGGAPECTLIAQDAKTNPVLAALGNGALAHSIDYDDAHDDAFVHPSASVVPAALVAGEYAKASGKDLITAVALGDDVICRMGFAVSNPEANQGLLWMLPVLLGSFSATVAASKLLGLDVDKTENALGLAYNRAGGSKELVIEPGALRGLYAMYPNMTGVLAALMAQGGVPGLKETFDGKGGFFNMYYDGVRDESAFDDMGQRFEGTGVSIKPWPCCRFTNSCVDAALQIAREADLDPTQVAKVTVYYAADEAKRCADPIELRRAPKTIPEAKLSLPFTVAQALAYRKIEISDFSAEALADPLLADLCAKTDAAYDADLESTFSKTMLPGRVRVELADGTVYDKRVDVVYGHPQNRMEWPDLVGKFRDCASYCAKPLSDADIERIAGLVEHLEDLDDVSALMDAVR